MHTRIYYIHVLFVIQAKNMINIFGFPLDKYFELINYLCIYVYNIYYSYIQQTNTQSIII